MTQLSFSLIFSAATGAIAPKVISAVTPYLPWQPTTEILLFEYEPTGKVYSDTCSIGSKAYRATTVIDFV